MRFLLDPVAAARADALPPNEQIAEGKIEAADRKEPLIEFAAYQAPEGHDSERTSWIWTALSNGLNNHIIHHLFPQVALCHYIALLPIVGQTCKDFKVQTARATAFGALLATFPHAVPERVDQ